MSGHALRAQQAETARVQRERDWLIQALADEWYPRNWSPEERFEFLRNELERPENNVLKPEARANAN